MLKLILWPMLIVGAVYFVILALLWRYVRQCIRADIKSAILEAHEEIETKKFYNSKND